ncbi:hypothetical protein [Undibacterium sp. JH2W]|uniref:hypothetical protein n=1 Tax=Undibacterium sp. JH2W TaxID=3413037 RepID=UPI003BF61618
MFDDINALNSFIVFLLFIPAIWIAHRSHRGGNAGWYALYVLLVGPCISVFGLVYFLAALAVFVLIAFVGRQKLMLSQFFEGSLDKK